MLPEMSVNNYQHFRCNTPREGKAIAFSLLCEKAGVYLYGYIPVLVVGGR
jgi:hypothetical protein